MNKSVSLFAMSTLLIAGIVLLSRPSTSEASNAQDSDKSESACVCGQCESGCGCCVGDACTCSSCECDMCASLEVSKPVAVKAACCASGKCSAKPSEATLFGASSACALGACDKGCGCCDGSECVCDDCACPLCN